MDSPECSIYASVCCTLNWVIGMCVCCVNVRWCYLVVSCPCSLSIPMCVSGTFHRVCATWRTKWRKWSVCTRWEKFDSVNGCELNFKWCILLLQQWYIAVKKNINLKALFGGSKRPQGHLNNPKTYLTLRYQVNPACYYLSKRTNNPPLAYTIYEILYFWDFSIFRFCVGQRNIPC